MSTNINVTTNPELTKEELAAKVIETINSGTEYVFCFKREDGSTGTIIDGKPKPVMRALLAAIYSIYANASDKLDTIYDAVIEGAAPNAPASNTCNSTNKEQPKSNSNSNEQPNP